VNALRWPGRGGRLVIMDDTGGGLWQAAALFALGGVVRGLGRYFDPPDPIGERLIAYLVFAGMVIGAASIAATWRGFFLLLFLPLGAYKAAELTTGAAIAAWLLWGPQGKGPPRR
jgi:hypothetical protein